MCLRNFSVNSDCLESGRQCRIFVEFHGKSTDFLWNLADSVEFSLNFIENQQIFCGIWQTAQNLEFSFNFIENQKIFYGILADIAEFLFNFVENQQIVCENFWISVWQKILAPPPTLKNYREPWI